MPKRKRPREEFIEDIRPLKKQLTWFEAVLSLFEEFEDRELSTEEIAQEIEHLEHKNLLKVPLPTGFIPRCMEGLKTRGFFVQNEKSYARTNKHFQSLTSVTKKKIESTRNVVQLFPINVFNGPQQNFQTISNTDKISVLPEYFPPTNRSFPPAKKKSCSQKKNIPPPPPSLPTIKKDKESEEEEKNNLSIPPPSIYENEKSEKKEQKEEEELGEKSFEFVIGPIDLIPPPNTFLQKKKGLRTLRIRNKSVLPKYEIERMLEKTDEYETMIVRIHSNLKIMEKKINIDITKIMSKRRNILYLKRIRIPHVLLLEEVIVQKKPRLATFMIYEYQDGKSGLELIKADMKVVETVVGVICEAIVSLLHLGISVKIRLEDFFFSRINDDGEYKVNFRLTDSNFRFTEQLPLLKLIGKQEKFYSGILERIKEIRKKEHNH